MHVVGIYYAHAVRRKRRAELQRARARHSHHSADLGEHTTASLYRQRCKITRENKVFPYVTWLRFGVLFLVLGLMCLVGNWLPNILILIWKSNEPLSNWFNPPVYYGLLSVGLGLTLLLLYGYLTRNKEQELENYVQKQLSRSLSGCRLVRDVETCEMRTINTVATTKEVFPEPTTEKLLEPHADKVNIIVNTYNLNEPLNEQIVEEEISGPLQHERRHSQLEK